MNRYMTLRTAGDTGSKPKPSNRTFAKSRQNGNKCPKYAAIVAELKERDLIIVNNCLLWTADPDSVDGKPTLMLKKPTMKTLRWFVAQHPIRMKAYADAFGVRAAEVAQP